MSTAPAATSLAILARGSLASVIKSTMCSMAVFSISVMSTKEIATSSATTSRRLSAKNRLAMSTRPAMLKWIHMLRSWRNA